MAESYSLFQAQYNMHYPLRNMADTAPPQYQSLSQMLSLASMWMLQQLVVLVVSFSSEPI